MDFNHIIISYGYLVSIPLSIGLPWSIKRFIKKAKEVNVEPQVDLNKLSKILDGDNYIAEDNAYMKEVQQENDDLKRRFWGRSGESSFHFIYWIITLFSIGALFIKVYEAIAGFLR